MAYLAFEQRKYSEALDAREQCHCGRGRQRQQNGKKDTHLPRLKAAIEESIKERDASAEALKAKQKL